MNKIKNSSMFFLWAGAAISISEIYTGCLVAPLGFTKGIIAILVGHLIGTLLLAFGGYISFKKNKNAMETIKDYLGGFGVKLAAILNILQLIGWSAIMILQGGRALNTIVKVSDTVAILIMALLVFLWAYFFNNHSKKINDISVIVLLVLCIVLFFNLGLNSNYFSKVFSLKGDAISFSTAIELSIAMPISWLPLIGDYTKFGQNKKGVFLNSFFGYFIASVFMYILGLVITIFTGKDVIEFLGNSSFSLASGLIIVLSTVTTTFLDIYSAVISSKQILKVENENLYIILYSIVATAIAFVLPIEQYQNFLLIIGSVFIPIFVIVFTAYIIGIEATRGSTILGISLAFSGSLLYYYFNKIGMFLPTILIIFIVSALYVILNKVFFKEGINKGLSKSLE